MEKEEILYIEKQKFSQIWLYILSGAIFIYINWQIVNIYVLKNASDVVPISITALIFSWLVSALVLLLTIMIRLEIFITKSGVTVRFFPFLLSPKHYSWEEISYSYVRKYAALSEYGGWGYRIGKSGKAFTTSGLMGWQLVFSNDKKLLLGTQHPEELDKVLLSMGKMLPIPATS